MIVEKKHCLSTTIEFKITIDQGYIYVLATTEFNAGRVVKHYGISTMKKM